ncbi:M61 family metallopeptidase [Longimicrobium sp.]|uniref:M61 family metallopeptidase n=1 Tax=Longimicrobium sp. TaxID=2029185 RepID=UPI002E315D72|nr:PDZ domain-containing protein [Longimicrobium sp.]HEX6038546.1 PDZ domain-containing protein [Longimicrobium sp.]
MARIQYRVHLPDPRTHLVAVEMAARDVHGPASLVMPSWTPGSYLLREFPRNVVQFEAFDADGTHVPFRKTDKGTWHIDAPADGTLRARWIVNADELTVRTSHVDGTHASLIGSSVFMYVDGRQGEPAEVDVLAPEGWRVTTALESLGGTRYRAADFDELVDSPLEIGTHQLVQWTVGGVPHQYAIWGRGNHDPHRLARDTTRIVLAEREIFGTLPYPAYTFIVHLTSGGGGGLEHRNCTSLLADRWSFRGMGYESFLGLAAHELFHAWNGKRIRPAALGPFDYTRENYTRDLWVVEGITTYYTDLLLRRAGIIPQQRYLEKLADMISRFQTLPGRAVQPLADSSFDTWIKFYRPDANTPNATISYYQKGALVALLLDLRIRAATENARSLDDLMRLLWERYGAPDAGFPEGAVEDAAAEVAGTELRGFFDHALRSTGELDYAGALAAAGLQLVPVHEAAAAAPPQGGQTPRVPEESRTGLTLTRTETGRITVTNVLAGSAAWQAGVNAGDELVALDGFRVPSPEWLNQRLMEFERGVQVQLTVFRRDELRTLMLTVDRAPPPRFVVRPAPDATPAQQAVRAHWLRSVVPDEPPADAPAPATGGAPQPALRAEP